MLFKIQNITKALADENRIRALMMLTRGELCVCQIIEMLGLAPSTVSKHMYILKQAGLVKTRKEGRWIYYRLTDKQNKSASEIINWLEKYLKNDSDILKDTKHLQKMKKIGIDKISECYRC